MTDCNQDKRKGSGFGDAQDTRNAGLEAAARKIYGLLQGRFPDLIERYSVEDNVYLLDVTHQNELIRAGPGRAAVRKGAEVSHE